LIEALLGLAVLTGPLWLILVLLPVAIILAIKLPKRFPSGLARLASGAAIFGIAMLFPFADEIVGRIYLKGLCATQAGVVVYQTVELPNDHWDEKGKPLFYDEKNGNFSLSKNFPSKLKIERYSPLLHIDKLVGTLTDQGSGKLISENITFHHWGGWVRRNLSPHNSATDCGNYLEQYSDFIRRVFKPASPNNGSAKNERSSR
jgi:hypothetical protein